MWRLPANYRLTDAEIVEARALHGRILADLTPQREDYPGALAAIAKLLVAYAVGQTTEQAAKGRAAIYLEVVRDVPGWAVVRAVDKWLRHEAGDYDYHWLPMPPEFRIVALAQTAELQQQARDVEHVLAAAGPPPAPASPEERARVVDGFRKLSESLGAAHGHMDRNAAG